MENAAIEVDEVMDSILSSIKQLVGGINSEDTNFDSEIIMGINTEFSILTQLGVGPKDGFSIIDKNQKWTDFIPDMSKYQNVRTCVQMRVRLLFDPPQSTSVIEIMKEQLKEMEWRLQQQAETEALNATE